MLTIFNQDFSYTKLELLTQLISSGWLLWQRGNAFWGVMNRLKYFNINKATLRELVHFGGYRLNNFRK